MKKRKMPLYGSSNGAYRGGNYGAYRNGPTKVYKHVAIFTGEAKQHKVDRVIDMLKDWQMTPFENEGAIRSGIRSGLCLQGYAWQQSDHEAATLINHAFMLMGVERPTWEEGQREYVEPRENCKWCGKAIPDDMLTRGKKVRFCSVTCAKAAYVQRSFEDKKHFNRVRAEVYRLFCRSKNTLRTCGICGKSFQPDRTTKGLYCSMECASVARRTLPECACANCGKIFRKKCESDRFCCMPCWKDYQQNKTPLARCDYCRKLYHKKFKHSRFCSVKCRNKMSELVTGRKIPKRLTPPVFDYFFARAA